MVVHLDLTFISGKVRPLNSGVYDYTRVHVTADSESNCWASASVLELPFYHKYLDTLTSYQKI